MNIGIVTTWFERGAAYVSRQYMEVLQKEHNVFVYARSGESYAVGDRNWDLPNVYWSKKISSPFVVTVIDKEEFIQWLKNNDIDTVIFNEQHWWYPMIWCKEMGVRTIAYIDYYTEQTVPLFGIYDFLICNTQRHLEAFEWHPGARYIPWGTDITLFNDSKTEAARQTVIFFHSCGHDPVRKGTDLLLMCLPKLKQKNFKLIIHTQKDLEESHPHLANLIHEWTSSGNLEIINKTVPAPGLFHMGQVYVYPSRLEGIGLTIAEAISCGLGVLVPDYPPMNEFVNGKNGSTIKLKKLYARHDGYYWPQNEICIDDLAAKIDELMLNPEKVVRMQHYSKQYAHQYLDWDKNADKILDVVNESLDINDQIKKEAVEKILQFENYGTRKFNRIYLKSPYFFSWLRKRF